MKKLYSILILILVGIILWLYFKPIPPPDENVYIKIGSEEYILLSSKVDTIWLTNETEIPVYVPKLVSGETVEILVPADVDTLAILKRYFAKNVYKDTILLDSVGSVSIKDTISENMIFSREVSYQYDIPTFNNTIIVKDKPKTSFYLGGGALTSPHVFSLYSSVLMKSKKNNLYSIKLGAGSTGDNMFVIYGAEMHWGIGKKN